ncbi:hypothetical protein [Janthinobacterium tructae]
MARHHVISTTACDVFFKLVAHQKKSLGAHFDSMIVTFSADYQLTLSNGETWTGTTDAKGRTGRVASKQEALITQAEFLPQADKSPCCAAAPKYAAPAIKVVQLVGIKTTDKDVGSSVKQVKVKDKVRPLTRGEIDMAWMLFQDAIDYSKVKVHGEPYL